MTPMFCRSMGCSLAEVVEELLVRKVHRLFVTDPGRTLIGVISASDVLLH